MHSDNITCELVPAFVSPCDAFCSTTANSGSETGHCVSHSSSSAITFYDVLLVYFFLHWWGLHLLFYFILQLSCFDILVLSIPLTLNFVCVIPQVAFGCMPGSEVP